MKKGVIILLLLTSFYAEAVEKYQLQFLLAPTIERYSPRNRQVLHLLQSQGYRPKLSYNFGFEYKRFLDPYVSFSTGLIFQNKGYTAKDIFNVYNLSVYYLSVPTNFNFHNSINKRLDYYFQIGLINGYKLREYMRVKTSRDENDDKINNPFSGSGFSDIENSFGIYKRWFSGLNIGFGFEKYVKAKFVVEINPTYTVQLNKAFKRDAAIYYGNLPYYNPRFDSFALNIKVGYYFNKQIQIIKEDF